MVDAAKVVLTLKVSRRQLYKPIQTEDRSFPNISAIDEGQVLTDILKINKYNEPSSSRNVNTIWFDELMNKYGLI